MSGANTPFLTTSNQPTRQLCPICNAGTHSLFVARGYPIRACEGCGYQFAEFASTKDHVQNVYGDDYFFGGGAGYPNYLLEADLLRQHGRRYGRMLKQHLASGYVLDVGSAAGFLLKGVVETGWRGAGIEPNAQMAAYAREQLELDVQTGTLERFHSQDMFDVVIIIQVLCHFTNPLEALAAAAELTRSNGWWLIETWNPESASARFFGKRWHVYSPPSTLHWFSPRALGALVSRFGFREVSRGRVAKRIKGAHAKSILRHNLQNSWARFLLPGLALLPDRAILPYPAEDVYWALYRRY